MMNFDDYNKASSDYENHLRTFRTGYLKKVEEMIKSMRSEDFIELLNIIIKGHCGASYIEVQFDVPYIPPEMIEFLKSTLKERGWRISDRGSLTFCGGETPFKMVDLPDYQAKTYERYEGDIMSIDIPKNNLRWIFISMQWLVVQIRLSSD